MPSGLGIDDRWAATRSSNTLAAEVRLRALKVRFWEVMVGRPAVRLERPACFDASPLTPQAILKVESGCLTRHAALFRWWDLGSKK